MNPFQDFIVIFFEIFSSKGGVINEFHGYQVRFFTGNHLPVQLGVAIAVFEFLVFASSLPPSGYAIPDDNEEAISYCNRGIDVILTNATNIMNIPRQNI